MKNLLILIVVMVVFACNSDQSELKKEIAELKEIAVQAQMIAEENAAEALRQRALAEKSAQKAQLNAEEAQKMAISAQKKMEELKKQLIACQNR